CPRTPVPPRPRAGPVRRRHLDDAALRTAAIPDTQDDGIRRRVVRRGAGCDDRAWPAYAADGPQPIRDPFDRGSREARPNRAILSAVCSAHLVAVFSALFLSAAGALAARVAQELNSFHDRSAQ